MKNIILILLLVQSSIASAYISDHEYQDVLQLFKANFSEQVLAKYGKKLTFETWDFDGSASVQCHDDVCEIIIGKGFFMHKEHKRRHLEAIFCHEMGHLLGMKYSNSSKFAPVHESKFSAEGEADYFSTNVCLPKIWRKSLPDFELDFKLPEIKSKCANKFPTAIGKSICMLSIDSARLTLGDLDGTSYSQNGDNPYTRDVNLGTNLSYPNKDCRFASVVSGALNEPRPACWYVPERRNRSGEG